MDFLSEIINNFNTLFTGTMGSVAPTATSISSCHTSSLGTENIANSDMLEGATTLTTATAASMAAAVDINDVSVGTQITQAYVESMSTDELNEFIEVLENVEIPDKPKLLEKTYKG